MNNRFKFRVWDFTINRFDTEIYQAGEQFGHPSSCDWIAQQYTGLTDSNDNPIYEDDIVKYNLDKPNIERIGIIEFSYYYKGWAIKDSHCYPLSDFGVYSLASPFLSFNWTEIVGNIFEHENLLK